NDDAMPLGLLLALAGGLVAPGLRGGHAEIGDRPPILRAPDFGILAEISDQNHLVHATCHRRSPLSSSLGLVRPQAIGSRSRSRTTLRRPYTLARAASSGIGGYPHIAFHLRAFPFC